MERTEEIDAEFVRVYPGLFGLANYFSGNRETAKDLVHDAVLRAYENLDKFHGGNLDKWICKIMSSIFKNQKQRNKISPVEYRADVWWFLEGEGHNPHSLFVSKDMMRAIEGVLDADKMKVMRLSIGGYTSLEIADKLQIPHSTVRTRLFYSYPKIEKVLS